MAVHARVASAPSGRSLPMPHSTRSHAPVKTRTAPVREEVEPDEEEEAEPTLKARTARLIESIRAPFRSHVQEFGRMHAKAADLAPAFMKAFEAWSADTEGTFVAFVRYLDPSVPAHADEQNGIDGYKANPVYQSADYLRRLVGRSEGESTEDPDKPAGMSEAFVRLLAAVIALIPGNQVEKLWGIIGTELRWSERRVLTLRTQVEEAEPLTEARVERNTLVVEEP